MGLPLSEWNISVVGCVFPWVESSARGTGRVCPSSVESTKNMDAEGDSDTIVRGQVHRGPGNILVDYREER